MATAKQRIYVVEDANNNVALVRAGTKAAAVNHSVKKSYFARVASQDDLIKYGRDIVVEDAGEEVEA